MPSLPWLLLPLALTLALALGFWGRGFLHHALRQTRDKKSAPQPARAYREAVVTEAGATLSVLINRVATWYQTPPDPIPHAAQGPPILLVPDPALPWSSLAHVSRTLQEHDLTNVHLLDARAHRGSLENLGKQVQDHLATITTQAGSLAIGVGHGAGGLALRWAYDHAQAPLLAHLVTVGTPHDGTQRAPFRGLPRHEVAAGSAAIETLDLAPMVPCTSIFSHVDDRMVPASSARWGDQAVAVPGVGHRGLVWSDRSTRVILAAVLAGIAEAGPPGDT